MFFIKKQRYKPIYKKFIILKQNVQHRTKLLNKETLKKKKWQSFLIYLKKQQGEIPDANKLFLSKTGEYFSNKFRYNLRTKQKLSFFYGILLKKSLKNTIKQAHKKAKCSKKLTNVKLYIIQLLETRLDSILYRTNLTLSFRNARQLICHRQITINKKTITRPSFKTKKGDLIKIKNNSHTTIKFYICQLKLPQIPPKYLQINYKTLQIIVLEDIKLTNIYFNYPFYLDFNTVLKLYER